MTKTVYYKAAELLDEYGQWFNQGACTAINVVDGDMKYCMWFTNLFEPSAVEAHQYHSVCDFWLYSNNRSFAQNKQDRIIALLFADLIYQDELKQSKQ